MGSGEDEAVLDVAEFVMGLVTAISFLTYVVSIMDVSVTGIIATDAAYTVNALISIPHSFSYAYSFDEEQRRLTLTDIGVSVTDTDSSSLAYVLPSSGVDISRGEIVSSSYTFESRRGEAGRNIRLRDAEDLTSFCKIYGDPADVKIDVEDRTSTDSLEEEYGSGQSLQLRVEEGSQNKIVYSRLLDTEQQAVLCQLFSIIMRDNSALFFSFEESPSEVYVEIDESSKEDAVDALSLALIKVVNNE